MHLFKVACIVTAIAYSFINPITIAIFLGILACFVLLAHLIPGLKNVANNRKISFAAWSEPREGNLYVHEEIRLDKVEEFLQKNYEKEVRPTLTHVVVRATAEALKEVPTLNAKIAFGQYVPFKTVDVSVLVEMQGGNDLAMMLLSDCGNKTFEDLREIIAKRSQKIRASSEGDQEHKKRTGAANFFPSFVLAATIKIVKFFTCDLGITLKMFGMRKNGFGVAMITAIGKLGFINATAPFTSFANNSIILAINKIHEKPIFQNGEFTTGKFVNINIVIDNRLFAQTDNRRFFPAFRSVFENPAKFSRVKEQL